MADSQVNQYRREQDQAERYYSADDLDACFEPDEEEPEPVEEDQLCTTCGWSDAGCRCRPDAHPRLSDPMWEQEER
jgi:hypothetical protein